MTGAGRGLSPDWRPRHQQGRAFGSYDPRTDGPPHVAYEPDYDDENGSAHIRPCPVCGAATDEPCDDGCALTATSQERGMSGRVPSWMIFCADGTGHRDFGVGEVSVAVSEEAAKDACGFMDEDRENSPWQCGPHTAAPA